MTYIVDIEKYLENLSKKESKQLIIELFPEILWTIYDIDF